MTRPAPRLHNRLAAQTTDQLRPLRWLRGLQIGSAVAGVALVLAADLANLYRLQLVNGQPASGQGPNWWASAMEPWVWLLLLGLFGLGLVIFGMGTMARFGAHVWDGGSQITGSMSYTTQQAAVVSDGQAEPFTRALLVVHGIGVQERFETAQMVVEGLTDSLPPHDQFREVAEGAYLEHLPEGCTEEDRKGSQLQRVMCDQVEQLDVYELYWADMTEDVLSWKGVLAWGGQLIFRVLLRLDYLLCGSRHQPHPRDLQRGGPERAEKVAKVRSDGRRKAWVELVHLFRLLAITIIVIWFLQGAGRVGLSLARPPEGGETLIAANPWAQIREAYRQTTLEDLTHVVSQGQAVVKLFAQLPFYAGLLLFLTATFFGAALRMPNLFKRQRADGRRTCDVIPPESFLRPVVRESVRSLTWLGAHMMGLGLYLGLSLRQTDLHRQLFGMTWLLVALVVTYVGLLGLKFFLSRYLADIPVEGSDSAYSLGRGERVKIHQKAVGLLKQLLVQYPGGVTVLAHSQGTVVSYEALHLLRRELRYGEKGAELLLGRLKAFVTIGIALSKVHEIVQGRLDVTKRDVVGNWVLFGSANELLDWPERLEETKGETTWYNYWLLGDLVANPVEEYLPVAKEEELDGNPWALWAHSDYWSSTQFYQRLHDGALDKMFPKDAA